MYAEEDMRCWRLLFIHPMYDAVSVCFLVLQDIGIVSFPNYTIVFDWVATQWREQFWKLQLLCSFIMCIH